MKGRKLKYPTNADVQEAILRVLVAGLWLKPEDLCGAVVQFLEDSKLYARHVSQKRIWRIFQIMVTRGQIPDPWNVVETEE